MACLVAADIRVRFCYKKNQLELETLSYYSAVQMMQR